MSILTDFDDLAAYDCTTRPRKSDKASHARIFLSGMRNTLAVGANCGMFSREAVWSGAFDQYAASKRKRGTSEVDVEFLKEIEGWREVLARSIAFEMPIFQPTT